MNILKSLGIQTNPYSPLTVPNMQNFHPFYFSNANMLISISSLDVLIYNVTGLNSSNILLQSYVGMLGSGKGVFSNSTSLAPLTYTVMLINHQLYNTTSYGNLVYDFKRSDEGYLLGYQIQASVTNVKLIYVSPNNVTFVGEFVLNDMCTSMSSKNMRIICTTATGTHRVYKIDKNVWSIVLEYSISGGVGATASCGVSEREVLVAYANSTIVFHDMNKNTANVYANQLLLYPPITTADGCFIFANLNGTKTMSSYYASDLSNMTSRQVYSTGTSLPVPEHIAVVDGVIFSSFVNGTIRKDYVPRPDQFVGLLFNTSENVYAPLVYSFSVPRLSASVGSRFIFPAATDNSRFLFFDANSVTTQLTPMGTTPFNVNCSVAPLASTAISASYYFSLGYARNPQYNNESIFMIILQNTNYVYDYDAETISACTVVVSLCSALTVIILGALGTYKFCMINKKSKVTQV